MAGREIAERFLLELQRETGYRIVDLRIDDEYPELITCHFHVKRCRGWLFGLWIDDNGICFFCQPEKYIDKFKPTATHSFFCAEFVEGNFVDQMWRVTPILKSIHYHPIMSFYLSESLPGIFSDRHIFLWVVKFKLSCTIQLLRDRLFRR